MRGTSAYVDGRDESDRCSPLHERVDRSSRLNKTISLCIFTSPSHYKKCSMWTRFACLFFVTSMFSIVHAADPIAPARPTQAPSASGAGAISSISGTPANSSIPSSAAAGGITITQPQQTAAQSYYKIAQGVNVTLGWNFTSVLAYPTSLVVQAYCSENSNTYTLASSLPGNATAFTWAPWEYDQSAAQSGLPQLIQATYRLQIFDERGLTVAAKAGLFQPNTKVEFALYQPKPYTAISGEHCSCRRFKAIGNERKAEKETSNSLHSWLAVYRLQHRRLARYSGRTHI